MEVVLEPDANAELNAAAVAYAREDEGRALRFLRAVSARLATLERTPYLGAPRPGLEGVRRVAVARFPYWVIYVVGENDMVNVLAVAHMKRRPGYWRTRLP